MGRPAEPEKKRELALRAVAVLEREGLELSVEGLARALGLKRPTLLYHFPTYADLVETALASQLTEQAAFVRERVEAEPRPLHRVYAWLRAVHEFHAGRERRMVFLTQALAATAGPRLESLLERGSAFFEPHRRDLAERLRKGMRQGTVARCDADSLVHTVRALVDGLLLQRVTEKLALEPAHAFVWRHLLAPLERSPRARARRARPKTKPLRKEK